MQEEEQQVEQDVRDSNPSKLPTSEDEPQTRQPEGCEERVQHLELRHSKSRWPEDHVLAVRPISQKLQERKPMRHLPNHAGQANRATDGDTDEHRPRAERSAFRGQEQCHQQRKTEKGDAVLRERPCAEGESKKDSGAWPLGAGRDSLNAEDGERPDKGLKDVCGEQDALQHERRPERDEDGGKGLGESISPEVSGQHRTCPGHGGRSDGRYHAEREERVAEDLGQRSQPGDERGLVDVPERWVATTHDEVQLVAEEAIVGVTHQMKSQRGQRRPEGHISFHARTLRWRPPAISAPSPSAEW